VISFLVISSHWRGHHRVYRYFTAAPPPVVWWNLLWMMMIVVTPFATRVVTEPGGFQVRFTFYALVQALTAVFLLLSVRVMVRRHLLDPRAPPRFVADAVSGLSTVVISFLVSIPLAFVTQWAFACWALGPMLERLLRRPRSS